MKTPKVKKRGVSKNSRAARRGDEAAPVTKGKSAVEETDYKPWLHGAQNAGISKKKKVKQLTRQQKERHQKGLEHADRNASKLEKKLADSKLRAKKIKSRAADWDDLNGVEPVDTAMKKTRESKDGPEAMEDVEVDEPAQVVAAEPVVDRPKFEAEVQEEEVGIDGVT